MSTIAQNIGNHKYMHLFYSINSELSTYLRTINCRLGGVNTRQNNLWVGKGSPWFTGTLGGIWMPTMGGGGGGGKVKHQGYIFAVPVRCAALFWYCFYFGDSGSTLVCIVLGNKLLAWFRHVAMWVEQVALHFGCVLEVSGFTVFTNRCELSNQL